MFAMPCLAVGGSVTTMALGLGDENPAAFAVMFKRTFGNPPLAYLRCKSDQSISAVKSDVQSAV